MMTLRALKIAGLLLCSCCASVHAYADTEAAMLPAMEPAEADVAASVNVKGIRDPDWKPYSAMLKGVKRFEENTAWLRPQS